MKVALIGASGQAGSPILGELAARGHSVTAIARNPDKIAELPRLTRRAFDVHDPDGLSALLKGHDVAIKCGPLHQQRTCDPDRRGEKIRRRALSGRRRHR